jgi:DnaJ family protein A protein 5
LTEFVRKRDPRVKAYLVEEQKRKEAAAAEQKARVLREKQEMNTKLANYKEQDWAKVDELMSEHDDDSTDEEEQADMINDDFYCVVCDKAYKSEKQFTTHENSKRHLENVDILRQEMLADEENFEFDQDQDQALVNDEDQGIPIDQGVPIDQGIDINDMNDEELARQLEELELLEEEESQKDKKKKKKNKKKMAPRWGFDETDASTTMDQGDRVEESEKDSELPIDNEGIVSPSVADSSETQEPAPEKEGAKTKREKRKEKKKLKEENANIVRLNEILINASI